MRLHRLFRSSRPDFIETTPGGSSFVGRGSYCSGLPGRTSLRHLAGIRINGNIGGLFRSSRPDFIETASACPEADVRHHNCSGLPGRTSLRHDVSAQAVDDSCDIVPVFQAGLH